MAARFNPPPGWPPAPEGWTPPPGWNPDPSWPPAPPGWQLWVDEGAPGAPTPDVARFSGGDAAATQAFPAQGGPGANDASKTATFQPGSFGGPPAGAPGGPGFGGPGGPGGPGGWQPGQPGQPGDGAPKGNKGWLIPVVIGVVALLAILGILFATGVFGGDDEPEKDPTTKSEKTDEPTDEPTDEDTDEPTEEPTDEDTDEPTEEPTDEETDAPSGETGTRSDPLAVDETAVLDDWSVKLSASNLDAWAEISATLDDFDLDYYAPADGTAYVMAPATVTYLGDDRSNLYSVQFVYVGGNGTVYDEECVSSYSYSGALDDGQELYTDAVASGNVCVKVPADQVDGGVWRVTADYSGEYEAYYATK